MRASLSTHLARKLGRFIPTRPQPVKWPGGVASFTFDDFPRSALSVGGAILERHGVRGTYYTATDLAETENHLGPMFERGDIAAAHAVGHEIACHTFRHLDCGRTDTGTLLADVGVNADAIHDLTGGYVPTNFAFPFGGISFSAKGALSRRFASCRGIGEGINVGTADFADLKANRVGQPDAPAEWFRRMIDAARASDGWVIFYTHDVAESPSRYGCTPEELEAIVAYAVSRCPVLPVRDVVAGLEAPSSCVS